jgi:hypothetical protein
MQAYFQTNVLGIASPTADGRPQFVDAVSDNSTGPGPDIRECFATDEDWAVMQVRHLPSAICYSWTHGYRVV